MEAWYGECHLRQGEQDYQCQAAIWADSAEAARAALAQHVEGIGYSLLWLEECLPALQYIARHGQKAHVADLVRSVHPGLRVVLGERTEIGANAAMVERGAYLTITELDDVLPLDMQLGIEPRKSVPDALYEPLLGQATPAAADIAHFGSVEAVPPLKTYAILDAAKAPYRLMGLLEASDLRYQSLFQGDVGEELKEVAPYLVALESTNSFTRTLFTGPDGINGLWDKALGLYFTSRASFEDVRKHLRKFTRVRDEAGKWYFFRFWEPQIFADYMSILQQHRRDAFPSLFGVRNPGAPTAIRTVVCAFEGKVALIERDETIPPPATHAGTDLTIARYLSLAAYARKFAQSYGETAHSRDEKEQIAIKTVVKYYKMGFKSRYHLGSFVYWALACGADFGDQGGPIIALLDDRSADHTQRFIAASREMKRIFGNRIRNYHGR